MLKSSLGLLCTLAWLFTGHSDVIQYLPFLHNQANSNQQPLHYLYRAYRAGDEQALEQLSQRAIALNDGYWLHFAKLAGSAQAQRYFSYLQVGNEGNKAAIKALNYSAKRGELDAQVALYHHWITQNQLEKAQHWLSRAAKRDAGSALMYAKWLSLKGQESQALESLQIAQQLGSAEALQLLNMRAGSAPKKYSELTLASSKAVVENCAQRLQFVASSLHSVMQGQAFIDNFANDERLKTLPICINRPLWLAPDSLTCSGNWQGAGRLGCNMTRMSQSLFGQPFTHVVVLAQAGKANVHNGVMFLDSQDDYNVFVHELAHFAGFVDEYPLSEGLASVICELNDAPNLRVSRQGHQPDMLGWQGLTKGQRIAVSESRTCDNHQAQAYKPSTKMTFMEFYDVPYIPPIYLRAWAERLANKPLLTPAYINFYQGYDAKGDTEQGTYWRTRYQHYLQAD